MCGRMALDAYMPEIEQRFEAVSEPAFEWSPRFNVPPKTEFPYPIVINDGHKTRIIPALWGLVPSFSKDLELRLKYETFNAKLEAIQESRVYSPSIKANQFCLVPTTGFYEWYKKVKPSQPVYIHNPKEKIFAFGGIWAKWKGKEEERTVYTFTIVTTKPDAVMTKIHHRMPVVIPKNGEKEFIDPEHDAQEKIRHYLQEATSKGLIAEPVAREYVSFAKEDSQCVVPSGLSLEELLKSVPPC